MRITNLGNDIPYKLSNIVYHFDKFLNTYKNFGVNDESLYYYNVHLKKHGLEDLIINIGPMTLLSSVLYEIFEQGQWLEISESMDYKPSERNMLNQFFESFKNEWKNNTPDYQEFFSELLQENLDDLVITEDDDTAVSQKALQLINVQQQVSDERNVDAGSKLENDSLIAMEHYHNVMLDTTDNAGEFIYNIIKDLNDSADELGYSEQEKFNLIKWGITGIVEDRLFTPSSVETNKIYDTPNYNISKQEFLDIFKFWINHLDNIGLDFDVVDLVMKIYKIEDEEDKFQITSFDIDNQSKINDYIEITFSFVTGINTKEYGEATVYPVLDENSNIDYIKSKIIIDSLEDDYFNEYNTDSDFKNELDYCILDNIDLELFNEDEDFTITEFSLNNQELDEDNNYIVGTFSCNIGGEGENAEFRVWEEFSKDKKVLFVEINGLNEKNQIEYDKFDDFSVELDELIKESINTDLWSQDIEAFENARPVEDNNIEVELVIEKLNSTKFPNPQVEFYYPHLNIESTEIVSKEKVIEFLNLLLNDDEFGGNFIVDDYTLKTLSPDYLSFNELLNKIMNIIPDSDFEDNEDVLYMVISNDLKIKLSVGAVIWNYLNDNFKR